MKTSRFRTLVSFSLLLRMLEGRHAFQNIPVSLAQGIRCQLCFFSNQQVLQILLFDVLVNELELHLERI
jgi:hypothetical protein